MSETYFVWTYEFNLIIIMWNVVHYCICFGDEFIIYLLCKLIQIHGIGNILYGLMNCSG